MISVVTWKWGDRFHAKHVNVLRAMLARHLHLPHQLVCITDDPVGIDSRIVVLHMPSAFADSVRCRRRMQMYRKEFAPTPRILAIDLDVVIVADITPIVDRPEAIVGWKVGHAGVYSGSFVLFDAGALDGAWRAFAADPDGYPAVAAPKGVGSDQAMLNHYLSSQPPIGEWTEADGFVTYYGRGYAKLEHLGVGPHRPDLPAGARIVVLGSADLDALEDPRYPWAIEHWRE